ncbi:uncharacterized protein Pyn_36901 [Prunus yedoensis var. nudiflora]|uniref:Ribonuclease H1 N-terminal domain-containing protein n=1 Tax=Prunus yedoensis var. nudiflora TaxID=2094558 RepID=A0A314YBW1_PRUYE|nr:uncharacterized protein Pyn_36901 [Prunus yedoensis var. nudiflora]
MMSYCRVMGTSEDLCIFAAVSETPCNELLVAVFLIYSAIFRTTGRSAGTSALCGPSSWKRRFDLCTNSKLINLESVLTRFHIQLYSSRSKGSSSKTTSPRSRKKSNPEPAMEPDKDSFYVVRKGDVVGVYKSFSDCQAQLGSSICDPPVSVYKGSLCPRTLENILFLVDLRMPFTL